MNSKKYHWILYFIAATIIVTVAVQVYWNYNNYKTNKQRVTNDIQISLDNALEQYYAELAKTDYLTIIKSDNFILSDTLTTTNKTVWASKKLNKTDIKSIQIESDKPENIDSMLLMVKEEMNQQLISENKKPIDSIRGFTQLLSNGKGVDVDKEHGTSEVQVIKGKKAFDSLNVMKSIGTILISMDRDVIEYLTVDSLLDIQFRQKDISPKYALNHYKADTLFHTSKNQLNDKDALSVTSKSTYLKPDEKISLKFENPYKDALKLSFTGIALSFLLSAAIISCLFYLLKIINRQKQLAEVKNDLISNITHEFKTPIATIGVALESIDNFNAIDDKEKTKSYLNISSVQLSKLNTMVEKLLETASLDSDQLVLVKEKIDIAVLLDSIVSKHQMQTEIKSMHYKKPSEAILASVDPFHFENAINNIIDNALKYGGNRINVGINQNSLSFIVTISDNGNSLSKIHKDKIFEKFYRVPKGDTHDVKGFGIGLFFTKKIIDKHGGNISVELKNKHTTFKITLPND